jgi:predicted dehydrogenase
VDEKKAHPLAGELGVRVFADVEEMLAAEEVDLVVVATPESDRLVPALACARAGAHLLLEKPLTPSLPETDELVQMLEASGVTATVNFLLRADPRFVKAKELVDAGGLGEIRTFFARRRGSRVAAETYAPWTDLLISTAIHDLDAMAWLGGAPAVRIYGESVVGESAKWGKEDAVVAVVRFANGAIGTVETSWVLPPTLPSPIDAAFDLAGTRGAVSIEGINHGMTVLDEERYSLPDLASWPIGRSGVRGALRESVDCFLRCLVTGQPPAVSLREARDAEEVVAALKASLANGKPTDLPYPASGRN